MAMLVKWFPVSLSMFSLFLYIIRDSYKKASFGKTSQKVSKHHGAFKSINFYSFAKGT